MTEQPVAARAPGRPPRASRRTLEEAAHELFLERGYEGTSIDDIARRAGISRTSVFNHIASKADLLWLDVDDVLDELERALSASAIPQAVRATAAGVSASAVPLVVTQAAVVGEHSDVLASGMLRVARLGRVLSAAWPACPDAERRARVYALTAALTAAWLSWARAGVGRGPLVDWFAPALAVLD